MYKYYLKRPLDYFIAIILLICLSPIFLLILLVLFYANKGTGIFFTQGRPGKNAKIYKVIKFKTMNDERDENGFLLSDSIRLTKAGKFIRKTSLDELPQLINVIRGEMSLIGPRPLMPEYLPLYTKEQARRHEILPGITGWAQVNGRNAISWKEKFAYDVWYVDNYSFLIDIKIIILTIISVYKKKGIYKDNNINRMIAFNGKN